MSDQVCYHCGAADGLRPYGPGASMVCIDCVMNNPEIDAIAKQNFRTQLEAVEAMSPYTVSVIGPEGPVPLTEELLAHLKELVEAGATVEILVEPQEDQP